MTGQKSRRVLTAALAVATVMAITACSDEKKDQPPIAQAGADSSVVVGQSATLSGSASADPEGNALTYQWTLASRPAGSTAALTAGTSATPSFVTDQVGPYAIDLIVSDGTQSSTADRVIITATNRSPVASAGADGSVTAGSPLILGASASDPDGHAITHAWTLVAKPLGSAATLPANAPLDATLAIDVAGTYVVRLEVSDAWSKGTDDRTITATSPFDGGAVTGTEATVNAELAAIAARIDAVLALGYNTINADQVMKRLTGNETGKAADSMTVIDIRAPEDFAKGHVPGAINIPFAELPDVLLGNPAAIGTKEIAIASYNGNDGTMANLLVNLARVPDPVPNPLPTPVTWPISRAIFAGMAAWTFDRELTPTRFDDDKGIRRIEDGAIATAATPAVDQGAFPAIGAFSAATDSATRKALVRARAYLAEVTAESDGPEAFWVNFVDYKALLADADPTNDPVVVSVRNLVDYNKGHVPGAFNAPYGQIAKLANFKNVTPSKRVYAYCYTGHTGGIATMALGIMGYDVRNLLYGMNGWTVSAAASSGQMARFDVTRGWDFPLHNTGGGESLATFVPPATGCKSCHTNLTALYAGFAYAEPPVPGAQNEGEG